MIKIVTNDGKDGNHPHVTFWIDTTSLSFIRMPDSDCSIQIFDDEALLTARFRFPVSGAGGRSPNTHMAIGRILDSSLDSPKPPYPEWGAGNIESGRRDEDCGMELSAKLNHNLLALKLHDPYGRQWEQGASASVELPIDLCPVTVRGALLALPHAMARDCLQLYDRHALISKSTAPSLG